ncbi:MAG: hypothetical protein MRY77_04480 [Rhodobacteraceae bacterium]|nr:hypothetical protein [Paracoccaceae bacterium]
MSYDTKSVTLHIDDMDFLKGQEFDWSLSHVEATIKKAFDSTDVGPVTSFKNFGMLEIVPGTSYSKAAYVEAEKGFFILSGSLTEHFIVNYARWD